MTEAEVEQKWSCLERNSGECIHSGPPQGNCDDCWASLTICATPDPAAGSWRKVKDFKPEAGSLYLVRGAMRLSVKLGRDIEPDHIAAALINDIPGQHLQEQSR